MVKDINPQQQMYNQSVMVALIESGYMQNLIKFSTGGRAAYPLFLIKMLMDDQTDSSSGANQQKNSAYLTEIKDFKLNLKQKTMVKEACCRQIIKFFENESRIVA